MLIGIFQLKRLSAKKVIDFLDDNGELIVTIHKCPVFKISYAAQKAELEQHNEQHNPRLIEPPVQHFEDEIDIDSFLS